MTAGQKSRLRREGIAARQQSGGNQAGLNGYLEQTLRAFAGGVLAGYWPIRGEADPRPAMAKFSGTVCLPVVTDKATPLTFRQWHGEPLVPGPYNTSHPAESAAELTPDVLIVPLAVFDRQRNRIGYGGGYYDRTLELLRSNAAVTAIGLAFSCQEVRAIPAEEFDQPLDMIVTDIGIIGVGHPLSRTKRQ